MSYITFSEPIRAIDPQRTELCVVANGAAGTLSLLIQEGRELRILKLDAAGWRALHTALGVPPAAIPKGTTFRRTMPAQPLNPAHARHHA